MDTQLNIDPVRALEFMQSYQGAIIKKVAKSAEKDIPVFRNNTNDLVPADHGKHARRIPQSAQRMNYQLRFINLVA